VVENDIGWRVHALVDFMFGRSVAIQSEVSAPGRAQQIERFLRTVFDRAGGVNFYQNLALLGAVYGFVDVLVRVAEAKPVGAMSPEAAARWFDLEPIEGPRAVPVLREADYRRWGGYMVHVRQPSREGADEGFLRRASRRVTGEPTAGGSVEHTEVWTADRHEWYRRTVGAFGGSRKLLLRETNRLGRIPVVHIQNLAQPLHYEGLSEVEPLIPLQDELNTRLSDRANRVTFQSFKMYLGKGIEGFTERSVGPGQMWATDNPEASIEEFGGDAQNPSEDAHIQEIRQALDKTSAVPPVAAGLLAGRVGNLTSENALRVVLMGLLARTQKKRVTYGQGIERLCELLLHAADVTGVFPNAPSERGVRLDWPDPLPEGQSQALKNAQRKLELGVPRKQVLAELGYEEG
jgi:hypothetical protein